MSWKFANFCSNILSRFNSVELIIIIMYNLADQKNDNCDDYVYDGNIMNGEIKIRI